MNSVTLVGRLAQDPVVEENKTYITLAIQREYKNVNGIYETDFIKCTLWNGIASATKDYCHKGDVVGVKGKLRSINGLTEMVADKVSFISRSPRD